MYWSCMFMNGCIHDTLMHEWFLVNHEWYLDAWMISVMSASFMAGFHCIMVSVFHGGLSKDTVHAVRQCMRLTRRMFHLKTDYRFSSFYICCDARPRRNTMASGRTWCWNIGSVTVLEYEENYTEDDDASLLRIILFCSYSLSSVSNQLIYLHVIMWVRQTAVKHQTWNLYKR